MIESILKTAWRNLKKGKSFSVINLIGLTIGVSCFILIVVFVADELNYDRYAENASDIYRVTLSVTGNGDIAVYPNVDIAVGEGMKKTFPEIRDFARISPASDFVKYGDKEFKEQHLAFADSNFLQMFSIPLLEGAGNALVHPNSIVVSRDFAKKYFGDDDPVGKSLIIGLHNAIYKITGLIDKIPDNSHFHFDALISFTTFPVMNETWSNIGYYTYLQLNSKADPKKLEAKFPQLVTRYVVPEVQHDMGVSREEAQKSVSNFVFSLQALTSIHLQSNTKYELAPNGDIKYVYIFSALALFVLLLACINFTNLSTARAVKRCREVGIRKVMGSLKKHLVLQFLVESLLFAFFSVCAAYVLIFFLLPYFNELANKNISYSIFFKPGTLMAMLLLVLATGILAGIYPAFFISAFNPIKNLKGFVSETRSSKTFFRSGMILFQFFISIALIISTLIVYNQLHYMQHKKLGYDKEQVLFVADTRLLGNNETAFEQELVRDNRVVSASISPYIPGDPATDGTEIFPKNENGNGKEIHSNIYHVDYDFLTTLGIHLKEGRFFLRDFKTDSASGVVINETAVRELGWKDANAVGRTIVRSGQNEFKVIGVMDDFHYASVKQKIAPLMLLLGNNHGGLIVKIKTPVVKDFLANLKSEWVTFHANGPLSYFFLDENFARLYDSEIRTEKIFAVFAVIAIVIASLGLFGLSAYVMEQRTKEIGIRKVLGATVLNVLLLVSREFLLLVCLACLIAIPAAYWAMSFWLRDFAYRANIGGWIFLVAAMLAIFVALATISFQAIKAAKANPVKSLKAE